MIELEISWKNCVDVCTDGSRAMTGKTAGLVVRVKELELSCSSSHCVLHRQELVAKTMERDLKTVLGDAVKVVKHITFRPLNARALKLLCEEMGSEHTALLLHAEMGGCLGERFLLEFLKFARKFILFFSGRPFYLSYCLVNIS
jgi:hypothetical protein